MRVEISEERARDILNAVFVDNAVERPDPSTSPLPPQMRALVAIAAEHADRPIPPIVVEPEPVFFCARLDFHHYNTVAIRIATTYRYDIYGDGTWVNRARSEWKQLRSLAHELGHWIHGGTYETHGFKVCEDAADAWADALLKDAGYPQGYDWKNDYSI